MAQRPAGRTDSSPSRRPAPRPVPQRDPQFAHLTLPALRAYRRALTDEEHRVSYWRRLVQARLDLLAAVAEPTGSRPVADLDGRDGSVPLERIRSALADPRSAGRQAWVPVGATGAADGLPPLPDLVSLWSQLVPADDEGAARALRHDLGVAELQLSAYRSALHRKLAAATAELVARYREDPRLALTALPLPAVR